MRDENDNDLIARVSGGDQEAFQRLYGLYYQRLFRFVYRMTRRSDLVDEIINDVMFVVWQKALTFNRSSRVSTWILGIAYNKALKALERSTITINEVPLEDVESCMADRSLPLEKHLEIENWVATAFDRLSPEQRAVMELTYQHGLHYSDIASILDCPENTVKTRMFYARKKLRGLLSELQEIPS